MSNIKIQAVRYGSPALLVYFWILASDKLSHNPSYSTFFILFSFGVFAVVAILIQVAFKEDIEKKIRKSLDLKVKERKEEIIAMCESLLSNFKRSNIPSYEDVSGVIRNLTNELQSLDEIRKKYNFKRGIIISAFFMLFASIFIAIFYIAPNIFFPQTNLTFAHVGISFLVVGLWYIIDIFITFIEEKIWE